MSTPEPPPTSPQPPASRRSFGKAFALFVVVVLLCCTQMSWSGCELPSLSELFRDKIRSEDLADPSLAFEPRQLFSGERIIENGRAYERGSIPLAPGTEVIFLAYAGKGDEEVIRSDGPPGTVTIKTEKYQIGVVHGVKQSLRLRDVRDQLKVRKRQTGTTLVIDVDGGRSGPHFGIGARAVLIVPPGTSVRQVLDKRNAKDQEANAAVEEIVPQQPMPKSQWPLRR